MSTGTTSTNQAGTVGAEAAPEQVSPHQILLRPLVTEKGLHKAVRHNRYSFEVVLTATKDQIRQAVESTFNVKVEKVAIQNRIGKARRFRFRQGKTKTWKKAIVKLGADYKIDFF